MRFHGPTLGFAVLAAWLGWSLASGAFLRAYASLLYALCAWVVPSDHPATAETLRVVCGLCTADVWWSLRPG